MNIPLMDKRVRSLEEMMADLIAVSTQTSVAMKEFGDRVDRSIEEGRADRMNSKEAMQADRKKSGEEMRQFREEMQEDRRSFKEEMREFREAMQADRKKSGEETHEFKDSMASFKEEMRLENREFNKKLGEIAHKQGRMAEDLVSPSICRILRETFKISALYECAANVRHKKIHPEDSGRMKEFDVVAECGDYVMVNETKSNPNASDIRKLRKTIRKFREYFPEHEDKKIVGSLAMLYAHKSLIKYASSKGILILAVGDELMDVMNEPGFKPTEF
jgi:uncharacterized tellurite resistance protein B-like protein